ncbi:MULTISPECIES: TAXI family TRAP transporter solute-binding subunit [Dethiosulfovibrio]|uniref:TAXI family TRAP transporter solute-binding subunit n=2 Tax=Dethiosulfovibrio TaxID=47054 RepID=A0ABS9EM61_9BACT|nr:MULTISPECIES: TAXI family TRAP transporter solute-binding subunit [Dethiosulfovibrio]MCF4113225.1 TAXI family TRAP transporter solute-binding subunit [Dethiosulfovibrio russensis]MCF4142289.1 TAXI family TRAP transporter solute-binding subunit [Dethiosulfovibrio marinus]MCF4144597.1 TAXI family TRAP transporter solute-binding subunit [Dethiosulfovibrio acidaminovorans]
MGKKKTRGAYLICAVMLLSFATMASAATERLLMGTSSAGASYYILGSGLAKVLSDNVDDMEVSVEVTGGPTTNIQLIQQGDMELGLSTVWLAGDAYNGTGWTKGKKYQNFRTLCPLYSSILYIYTLKDSGIKSVYDLEGKNVSVGAPGATSELAGRAVLKVLGIKPKSISSLPTSSQVNGLKDGLMDAVFAVSGVPASWLLDLETTHDVAFIPLEQKDMDKVLQEYPFWSKGSIPAGSYKNQGSDVPVFAFWNASIAAKNLSEKTAYNIVKTTFECLDQLIAVDPTAKQASMDKIQHLTTPLHPGALKYYHEQGIEIPERLILK